MPVRLDANSADFTDRFERFLATKREVSADIETVTRSIVEEVGTRGDAALIEATRGSSTILISTPAACASSPPRSLRP